MSVLSALCSQLALIVLWRTVVNQDVERWQQKYFHNRYQQQQTEIIVREIAGGDSFAYMAYRDSSVKQCDIDNGRGLEGQRPPE